MKLKRRPFYFSYTLIWPIVILSAMTLMTFQLSPDSAVKCQFSLTVMLTASVFILSMQQKLSKSSDHMSMLAIYMNFMLATMFLTTLTSVVILNLHTKQRKSKIPKAAVNFVVLFSKYFQCCEPKKKNISKRLENQETQATMQFIQALNSNKIIQTAYERKVLMDTLQRLNRKIKEDSALLVSLAQFTFCFYF